MSCHNKDRQAGRVGRPDSAAAHPGNSQVVTDTVRMQLLNLSGAEAVLERLVLFAIRLFRSVGVAGPGRSLDDCCSVQLAVATAVLSVCACVTLCECVCLWSCL